MEAVDTLIARLRSTDDDDERDEIKAEIIALGKIIGRSQLREYVEDALKQELLEVQWELEEVVEALSPPKKTPEPEPEPVDDPTQRALRPSEIELVYNDPRGLRIYKSTVDDRWVVSQIDPRVGQPVTYEIPGSEAAQIKRQLAGSPYWLKEV
jgi:hypothetical protein